MTNATKPLAPPPPAAKPASLPPRPQPAAVKAPPAQMVPDLRPLGLKMGKRADLVYGFTGTTKTTQLGWAAEYIHSVTGKACRMVTADPGGYETIESVVKKGWIKPYILTQQRRNLYETMQKLMLGWWPENPEDYNSTLIEPSRNGIQDIGGFFFESLTSMCELLMHINMTDLAGVQVPRSDAEKSNIIKSGEFVRRFASQTDYGSIQDVIADFVRDSSTLPGYVIWTAQETKGQDEAKRPVYGPDLIGQKATGKCGPWFGNFLHLDHMNVSVEHPDPLDKAKTITVIEPRPYLFLKPHIDPSDQSKLIWPAKTRAPKELWQKVPPYMEPRMDKFYKFMAALQTEANQSASTEVNKSQEAKVNAG